MSDDSRMTNPACAGSLGAPAEPPTDTERFEMMRGERDHLYSRLNQVADILGVRPGQTTTERASELSAAHATQQAALRELVNTWREARNTEPPVRWLGREACADELARLLGAESGGSSE